MLRHRVREGVRERAKLHLPFRGGRARDESGEDQTIAAVGVSHLPPQPAGGYWGRTGMQFGMVGLGGSAESRLDVTGASLATAGDLSLRFWMLDEDSATERIIISRLDTTGSLNDVFKISGKDDTINFKVWDAAGTSSYTLTNTVALRHASADEASARWVHVAVTYELSPNEMSMWIDGDLVARETVTLGALANTSLGALEIGGASGSVYDQFVGRLDDVIYETTATTGRGPIGPNMEVENYSRRHFQMLHLDPEEQLQGASWTTEGGAYYIALSALTNGAHVIMPQDVLAVRESTGATETTYTEVGNVTDVKAGSDNYFVDLINLQLWSSEDPTVPTVWAVRTRLRFGDVGRKRGFNYYAPAVLEAVPAARASNEFGEPPPAGGSGGLVLASRHDSVPDGLADEGSSNVVWPDAPCALLTLSDELPWAVAMVDHFGIVDSPPTQQEDRLSFSLLSEMARLHRVPMEIRTFDEGRFPNMDITESPYSPPTVYGRGLRRVEIVMIDSTATVGSLVVPKWKINNDGISYMRLGWGTTYWDRDMCYNIDLDAATFQAFIGLSYTSRFAVWADIAGPGTPASPTSPTDTLVSSEYGDAGDAHVTIEDVLQHLLTKLLPSPSYGSTWTDMATRVGEYFRIDEPFLDQGGALQALAQFLWGAGCRLWYNVAGETWECRDFVVKSDSADDTVRDVDILSEAYPPDRTRIAKRINLTAFEYTFDAGVMSIGRATSKALAPEDKYDAERIAPALPFLGVYNLAAADTWATKYASVYESPLTVANLRLSSRFRTREVGDKLVIDSDGRPPSAGTDYWIREIAPLPDGSVAVVADDETIFPSDATSTVGTRAGLVPVPHFEWGSAAGATTSSSSYVVLAETSASLFGGDLDYGSNDVERFQCYAEVTGGGTGEIRLRDVDNNLDLFEITGIAGAAAMQTADTTLTNLPASAMTRLELQGRAVGGGTLEVWSASWMGEEDETNLVYSDLTPKQTLNSSHQSGETCSTTGTGTQADDFEWLAFDTIFPYPNKVRFTLDADDNGATGFRVYLAYHTRSLTATVDFGTLSGGRGFTTIDKKLPLYTPLISWRVFYDLTSGSGIIYGLQMEEIQGLVEI